jgi:hypothetical protein
VGQGEQLTEVRFDPAIREQLTAILIDCEAGKLGPGHGPAVIIRRLEKIASVVPALARPDVSLMRGRLEEQRRAARLTLQALDRGEDLIGDLLTGELTLRGWDAAKFMANLREGLGELEEAIAAIEARAGENRGGAPARSPERWLRDATERELTEAGVDVSGYEDGTLARILRILWKPLLGREAPIELGPWLKHLKSRR